MCAPQTAWADLDPEERARLKSRQGVAMIHAVTVRVVEHPSPGEQHLVDVPADGVTLGEVVMTGNGVMKGYFGDEEARASAFAGGWLHSGDLGVMHPDGYVQLLDRAKEIVVPGGENCDCRTLIARYKVPAAVAITEALPRTSTGKVRKNALRDGVWAGWDSRIN